MPELMSPEVWNLSPNTGRILVECGNLVIENHLAIPSLRVFCRLKFTPLPRDPQPPVDENALAIAFDKAPSLRRR